MEVNVEESPNLALNICRLCFCNDTDSRTKEFAEIGPFEEIVKVLSGAEVKKLKLLSL